MKRFSVYIITILSAVCLLLFVMDFIYSYVYKHTAPRNKVANLLTIPLEKIDYVFLGSSRVDNTIDASLITKITGKSAINLGVQGGKLDDYYLMLQLLAHKKIKTDSVFIQVDYVYNIDGTSEILKSNLIPHISVPVIDTYIKERDPNYWSLRYIPFFRYMKFDYKIGFREFFNSSIGKTPKFDLMNGYSPKYKKQGGLLQYKLPDTIAKGNSVIEKIIAFAKTKEITVVFFTAPFCKNTQNISYIDKLKTQLPTLIDYSRLFIDRDDYFYNCSHLNNAGAQRFTEIFTDAYLNTNP